MRSCQELVLLENQGVRLKRVDEGLITVCVGDVVGKVTDRRAVLVVSHGCTGREGLARVSTQKEMTYIRLQESLLAQSWLAGLAVSVACEPCFILSSRAYQLLAGSDESLSGVLSAQPSTLSCVSLPMY